MFFTSDYTSDNNGTVSGHLVRLRLLWSRQRQPYWLARPIQLVRSL